MNAEILIKVEGLQKHYKGGEIKALDGIDTEIRRGEVVVVIGPSGSGKSTFLRCLNLLELPTGGTILFDGTDITASDVNINIHRQKMGMVFQHFNLFPHKTILENMTLGPHQASQKIQKMRRKERWRCWSGGAGGQGQRLSQQLSGGQKQRIAIVRSLGWTRTLCCLMSPQCA